MFLLRSNVFFPPLCPEMAHGILSDVRVPVLNVICEPCGRRERFDVERLMRQYGWDAKLADLLARLTADCPREGLGECLCSVSGGL